MDADSVWAWVVMGVSGCGKSEVGARLAQALGAEFIEGDRFHSADSIAKMSAGIALTDADREGWLLRLREELARACCDGKCVVLACSALKRAYRDTLRGSGFTLRFVHLDGGRDTIAARMGARAGHFMPASLLDSQLRDLEPLQPDEAGIVLDLQQAPDQLVAQLVAQMRAQMRARRPTPPAGCAG
jgi:gluconokinase